MWWCQRQVKLAHLQEHVVLPTPPLPPTKIHFKESCSKILRRVGSSALAPFCSPILAGSKLFCSPCQIYCLSSARVLTSLQNCT